MFRYSLLFFFSLFLLLTGAFLVHFVKKSRSDNAFQMEEVLHALSSSKKERISPHYRTHPITQSIWQQGENTRHLHIESHSSTLFPTTSSQEGDTKEIFFQVKGRLENHLPNGEVEEYLFECEEAEVGYAQSQLFIRQVDIEKKEKGETILIGKASEASLAMNCDQMELQAIDFQGKIFQDHRLFVETTTPCVSLIADSLYFFKDEERDVATWLRIDEKHAFWLTEGEWHLSERRGVFRQGVRTEEMALLSQHNNMTIEAREAEVEMNKSAAVLPSLSNLSCMVLHGPVHARSDHYDIDADRVDFSEGKLCFSQENSPCEWRDHHGSRIEAVEIVYTLDTEELLCKTPRGQWISDQRKSISFAADQLHWNVAEHVVWMQNHVALYDGIGRIEADSLRFQYDEKEGNISPHTIYLSDHVVMRNQCIDLQSLGKRWTQYVLADEVVYFPEIGEMTISGKAPNRALFYDAGSQMEMSADALLIRDVGRGRQPQVQGIGNVIFSLNESEVASLLHRFPAGLQRLHRKEKR